jgi:pyruvate carboxylase
MYKNACVSTTEEAVASCQVVGYPAMIKASWGGGGKGIRKVGFLFQLNCGKEKGPLFRNKMKLKFQSKN